MLKLAKKEMDDLIKSLRKNYEVIAPVQQDILRYKILEDNDQVVLERPLYPPKNFFLPAEETIFSFKKNKIKADLIPKKRIILMSRCDANSLLKIDELYLNYFADENYKNRRENTLIIEFFCNKIYPNCFCNSMELKDCFDLKFFETGDSFYVKVGTDKGKALLTGKFKETEDRIFKYKNKRRLNKKKTAQLRKFFKSKIWEKEAENCLSCAACTSACPNCCCFDVNDEIKILNLTEGERKRRWDSCQLLTFTEVAGGHIFRENRTARLKHRIYHKLCYFKEEYEEQMCTGCGRCITVCPTGIDMLKIIERLK